MRIKPFQTAIILLLFVITGCTAIYENGKELAADAKRQIEEITVEDLNTKIESGEEYLLIDVRQPGEFASGNIAGSVNISRGELIFKIGNEDYWMEQFMYPPATDQEIIIYCKAGDRGILETLELKKIGYINVKNLKGGYIAFNPDGVTETAPASSGGCGD